MGDTHATNPPGFGVPVVDWTKYKLSLLRALADVVATKLGIILSSFSFFFLPLIFLLEGICLRFLHAFLSNKKNKI